jgi:hypothetical protein
MINIKNKRVIIIALLILLIFIVLIVYFCREKLSCGPTMEPEEEKTGDSLPELLNKLTPKNAPPLTAEEATDLERLKEELTP